MREKSKEHLELESLLFVIAECAPVLQALLERMKGHRTDALQNKKTPLGAMSRR